MSHLLSQQSLTTNFRSASKRTTAASRCRMSASAGNDLTLKILRREALTRVLTHPGELGVARAYVAGDLDIDGELDALFDLSVPPLRSLLKLENLRALAVSRRARHVAADCPARH